VGAHQFGEFSRRSALYTRCDARLRHHTRFFAAAATINAVLAKHFEFLSTVRAPRSLSFLSEVGAALEADNLHYARLIGLRAPGGVLDEALVRAEQRRLQDYVRAHQAQRSQKWTVIRGELNGLLNIRYAGAFLSRWWQCGGSLLRVLRDVRGQLCSDLDFADESHRIRIGLGLIEHIRLEQQPHGRRR
jgi:hypothetical protein